MISDGLTVWWMCPFALVFSVSETRKACARGNGTQEATTWDRRIARRVRGIGDPLVASATREKSPRSLVARGVYGSVGFGLPETLPEPNPRHIMTQVRRGHARPSRFRFSYRLSTAGGPLSSLRTAGLRGPSHVSRRYVHFSCRRVGAAAVRLSRSCREPPRGCQAWSDASLRRRPVRHGQDDPTSGSVTRLSSRSDRSSCLHFVASGEERPVK